MAKEKDRDRIRHASWVIDQLRAKSALGWSGAGEVIKWRRLRRGGGYSGGIE